MLNTLTKDWEIASLNARNDKLTFFAIKNLLNLGLYLYIMVTIGPNTISNLSPAARFLGGEVTTPSGLVLPASVAIEAPELISGSQARTVLDAKEGISAASASESEAKSSDPTENTQQSIQELLAETLTLIFNSNDEPLMQTVIGKLQDIPEATPRADDDKVRSFLEELNSAIKKGGDTVSELMNKTDSSILLALRDTASNSFEKQLMPLLEHGSLPVSAGKLTETRLKDSLNALRSMYQEASPRANLTGDREAYSQSVYEFKQELSDIIERDAGRKIPENPMIARAMLQ